MLKRIDSALSADFLWMLAAMGHGDDVALVDARNSDAAPRRTTTMPVSRTPHSCCRTSATCPRLWSNH